MKALRLALALLAVLAAGCGSQLFRPDEAREVAALLDRYRLAAAATADEQRRDLAAAQAAYDKQSGDAARLALALALLLPQVAHDDARVEALLGAVPAGTGGQASARYDLAQTLLALVAERQRLQRDDLRKQEQLSHQLREERRRTEELQQKIESLRAIDRDLRSRRSAP